MTSTSDSGLTGLRLDAVALRVLAHPLRSRLLSALRIGGPATATELAQSLGPNSGATSYHLRKLESVGLVAATCEGPGKRLLWRASSDFHHGNVRDFDGHGASATALNCLARGYLRRLGQQFERWLDVEGSWPIEWRDAAGMSDSFVLATADQAEALQAELDEVLAKYRLAGQGLPDARHLAVYSVIYPMDLDEAPGL